MVEFGEILFPPATVIAFLLPILGVGLQASVVCPGSGRTFPSWVETERHLGIGSRMGWLGTVFRPISGMTCGVARCFFV
jgi:hypothetical protein